MCYANPSLKKVHIGYRGAWAAFGVEFNFPFPTTGCRCRPVDFSYAKHDDGSTSVTIGNIDRVYGMEWSVLPQASLKPKTKRNAVTKVWWVYIAGSLRHTVGETEAGRTELRDALLLPDRRMSHHYIRPALSESNDP
jgi:hypothetical protein